MCLGDQKEKQQQKLKDKNKSLSQKFQSEIKIKQDNQLSKQASELIESDDNQNEEKQEDQNDNNILKSHRKPYKSEYKQEVVDYVKKTTIPIASIVYQVPIPSIKNQVVKENKGDTLLDQRIFYKRPLKYLDIEQALFEKIIQLRKEAIPIFSNFNNKRSFNLLMVQVKQQKKLMNPFCQ
ncbi:hypothetical protein ABPG72_005983 [Tetrahymena utriculariae]